MVEFETLGGFYLGKVLDTESGTTVDAKANDVLLYDSKDLTTHAVIIGMTGSGKTGLGIGMLEEALVDNIPLIAVDPKGDLSNLLLSFPELNADAFRPWINEDEAVSAGQSADAFAQAQAKLWQQGLADWGMSEKRIAKLRQSVDMAVYTPGSSAGLPVSVLASFQAPAKAVQDDADAFRDKIQSTATSLLALLGIQADAVTSREHILLANILEHHWRDGKNLDLATLIHAIQAPPFERIGVMDLDSFYPSKDRFELAMKLNSLLASPGFEAWLEGEPLDINRMLYTPDGKARASIFSVSHLSDSERMFFISMLLNELLAWTRSQSGTTSLRALFYMDEIYGYLPPTANPPSKTPMLTLLKQARAFGLGLVLSTQNPVDLDYKALSNAGTWFIGRLQTERDKARVLEGLESANSSSGFDKARMSEILSSLGKRKFLLHNVHEDAPLVFQTRWAMSYLRGPLTREHIKQLMADKKQQVSSVTQPPAPDATVAAASSPSSSATDASTPPIVPDGIPVYYAPANTPDAPLHYVPAIAGFADVHYSSVTHGVNEDKVLSLAAQLQDGPVALDWDDALVFTQDASALVSEPVADAVFAELPASVTTKAFTKWQKDFLKHVRQDHPLKLFKCRHPKKTSQVDEDEAAFRASLAQYAREERDLQTEKLRKKYASKLQTLQERLRRAEQAVQKETEQARQKQMDTVVSVGTALLGAFMGRKVMSRTNATRAGSAIKSAGRMQKEQMDIAHAKETILAVQQQISDLESQLEAEIQATSSMIDPSAFELEDVLVKAKSADITLQAFTLLWLPYRLDAQGRLVPDWA